MKPILISTLLLLATFTFAQVEEAVIEDVREITPADSGGWKTSGYISIIGSQAYFENWSAGGENSWAFTSLLNYDARYDKGPNVWEFSLHGGYGKILQGKATDWKKNDDKLQLNAKYGRKSFKKFYYAGLADLKTQFDSGYDYTKDTARTSAFMAPGYMLFALGMDFMPNEKLSIFLSPVTSRSTFVLDQELADKGAFGVDSATHAPDGTVLEHGKKFKSEVGGYMRINAKYPLAKNIDITSKLDLYSNYMENPQNIDVDWEMMLTMKINEYLSANISTHLIYDDDIPIPVDRDGDGEYESTKAAVQFKELFGIGFNYKFK